ncbi:MAG: transporter substrate-binding domain-containing protein [Candidatus Thiodiazotropha sp. L084R]
MAAQDFKIYTEEFPPYNYTKGENITGISTEIVREMLRRLDHPDTIEVSSWTRAYRLAQENDNAVLYSTTRSPIREDLFKWVGPLVPNNLVFFARSVDNISIASLDDARKVGRIGVYKDDYGELLLKENEFTNLRSIPDNRINVKDLVDGKIDLWIMNELTGNHMTRELGYDDKIEKVFDVQKKFMYIAFPKNTPDNVIEKWQNTLDDIKDDGTYAQIFSSWIMFSFTDDLKSAREITLSDEERIWLAAHPVIKVATDPDYPPFQFTDEGGVSKGIANDYLNSISEKLGITIEPVLTKSWQEAQDLVKIGDADMLAVATRTPNREKYLHFTEPYVEFPDVIIVRNNRPHVASLNDLKGKTLATIPGYAINDYIRLNYPDIELIFKADTQSLLRSLSTGEVEAGTLNSATISYQIEKTNITNLKVSSLTGFSYKLALASRHDWPILNQILRKSLDSFTQEERTQIERNWISLSRDASLTPKPDLDELTSEERKWLSEHPVIISAPDPAWPPVEYFDEIGNFAGMTADYLALLEEKLGVTFKVKRLKNWESVLDAARSKTIDMITAAVETPDRKHYLHFTKPYLSLPSVIIVDRKIKGNITLDDLKGRKVSVVSGFSSYNYLKENYPEIILDPVFNTAEGLRKVAYGKSYALVGSIATSTYLMEKEVITNLRIAGESGYTFHLSMAPRKDWPILNTILEKGLNSITREEHHAIYEKWIAVPEKPWITFKQFLIGLAVVLGVTFVAGIVVWNRQLSHQVELRTKELKASEEEFKNLYNAAIVGLFRMSIDGSKFNTVNPAFAKLFGYETDADVIQMLKPENCYADLKVRDELTERIRKEGKVEEFEFIGKRRDGTERHFILNVFMYKEYLEGAILDITERKKNEAVIRKLAMTDPLTELANRNRFNEKLEEALAHSKRYNHMVGLLLIDLDDFKPVNDNYGHPIGDKLLKHIARELNQTFREVDTIARLGGDEFAVVLSSLNSKTDAEQLTQRFLASFSKPIIIDQHTIHIGASMGLCCFPGVAEDSEGLLHHADKALYKAKALGKNQIVIDPGV